MRHRPENLIWVMPAEGSRGPNQGSTGRGLRRGSCAASRAQSTASRAAAFVIAADSGLDHARAHDIKVDLVVGDLDSVSDAAIAAAIADGVSIETYPRDKDATDLAHRARRRSADGRARGHPHLG